MKKNLIVFCSLLLSTVTFSQAKKPEIALIPEPVYMVKTGGTYTLPKSIIIETSDSPELQTIAEQMIAQFKTATGYTAAITPKSGAVGSIKLMLNASADKSLGNEGYSLVTNPSSIIIKANKPAGIFYGVQTLMQLFPKEISGKTVAKNVAWQKGSSPRREARCNRIGTLSAKQCLQAGPKISVWSGFC